MHIVSAVDATKVSMETKQCRGSHNKIKRLHRASDLKVRTSSIMSLPCVQQV